MPANQLPEALNWMTLTRTLDELRSPNDFIVKSLYPESGEVTYETEVIEVSTIVGGRRMAPFVMPGAGALVVPGRSMRSSYVQAPNIRIKRPFAAAAMAALRRAGTNPYVSGTGSDITQAIAQAIAGDLLYMRQQIDDTREWMAAQSLAGSVTYVMTGADQTVGDAFTIDYGRPAGHTIVLSGTNLWTEPAATSTKSVRKLVNEIDLLFNNAGMGNARLAIMGATAAEAFIKNEGVAADLSNQKNIFAGAISLATKFNDSGAKYLGNVYGVDWWQYGRQVTDPFGATVDLIDPKRVHFISPMADFQMAYGGIPEIVGDRPTVLKTRLFSKAWVSQDPAAVNHLIATRPLPIVQRPEATASVQVVA